MSGKAVLPEAILKGLSMEILTYSLLKHFVSSLFCFIFFFFSITYVIENCNLLSLQTHIPCMYQFYFLCDFHDIKLSCHIFIQRGAETPDGVWEC